MAEWLRVETDATPILQWSGTIRLVNLQSTVWDDATLDPQWPQTMPMPSMEHCGALSASFVAGNLAVSLDSIGALMPPVPGPVVGKSPWGQDIYRTNVWRIYGGGSMDDARIGYLVAWWRGTGMDELGASGWPREDAPEEFVLDIELGYENPVLQVERTAPYAPDEVGLRGPRMPLDYSLRYRWTTDGNTWLFIRVACDDMIDADGNPQPVMEYYVPVDEEHWGEDISPGCQVWGRLVKGQPVEHLVIDNLYYGDRKLLFNGWHEEFGSDDVAVAWGDENSAHWALQEYSDPGLGHYWTAAASIGAFHEFNLSGLAVTTAPKGELDALAEDAVVDMFGHSGTVKQWRAFDDEHPLFVQYVSWQGGWEDNSGLPGACAGPLVNPRINYAWAEEHGHHLDDLRIVVDAGGLDWNCIGDPYRALVVVQHETDVEVCNPLQAEECPATAEVPDGVEAEWRTSYAGRGAGWLFSVGQAPASRTVTVHLRSNVADRMREAAKGPLNFAVPEGYAPEWVPPPIPECHRILRAGGWRPDDEPPESACDWDDFAWLRLVLACTGDWTPEDCTVEVGFMLPSIYDNFLSGDARWDGGIWDPEGYTVEWGQMQWLEYRVVRPERGDPVDGNRYVCLLFPRGSARGGGSVRPDLRWVRALRVTFPKAVEGEDVFVGAHLSGPPPERWTASSSPEDHVLAFHAWVPEPTEDKSSFGPDVGWSAVTDGKPGARTVVPWKRRTEEGIPWYYLVIGQTSGYDLGAGASYQQAASEFAKRQGWKVLDDDDDALEAARLMIYEGGDDEHGGGLWTPQAVDAREGEFESGRLYYPPKADRKYGLLKIAFAQRVREVWPPAQWRYDLHALKHLAGGVWGVASNPKRPVPTTNLKRLRDRSWERTPAIPEDVENEVEGVDAGEWGQLGRGFLTGAPPLVAWPQVTGALLETGIGPQPPPGVEQEELEPEDRIVPRGVIDVREFAWWIAYAQREAGGEDTLATYTDPIGSTWVAWADEDAVLVTRVTAQPDRPGEANNWRQAVRVGEIEELESVGVTGDGHTVRIVAKGAEGLFEFISLDLGGTWDGPREVNV